MSASYDETYFEKLYQVEDRHFWFRTRRAIVAALCSNIVANLPAGYRVMEIGCGTGHLLKTLKDTCVNGEVVGLDLFWEGLAFASQRTNASLVQGQAEWMPFVEGNFDLIGMFDVLEHLENDEEILGSVLKMLKKGGKLMLTVPAERQLWSTTDLIAHHQRRYEMEELKQKLVKSGFQIDYISECMQALHPLARMRPPAPVVIGEMSKADDLKLHKEIIHELKLLPVLNEIAFRVLSLEIKQIRNYKPMKRGTSIIAVARRPD
jgi:ubiquinone/menaquinone biosynthesis C-methylase UbiE